mmetsp:Transcript_9647/g.18814  ORF Transcript_9647/g.18814 Transcript_9647/m.18814 type:complete len:126 (+) Transcript_9647:815-1192(+)
MHNFLYALALSLIPLALADPPTLYHQHSDGSTIALTLKITQHAANVAPNTLASFLEIDRSNKESNTISNEELWLIIVVDLLICACCCGFLQLMLYFSKKMKLRWVRLKRNYEEIERLDMVRSYDI